MVKGARGAGGACEHRRDARGGVARRGAGLGARRAARARRVGREEKGAAARGQQQRSRRRQSGRARGLGRTSLAGHGFLVVVLALVGDVVGVVGVALDVLARGAVGRGAAVVRPREGRALDYLLPVLAPAVSVVDAGHGVRVGKAVGAKVSGSVARGGERCVGVGREGGGVRPACGARRGVRIKSRQVASRRRVPGQTNGRVAHKRTTKLTRRRRVRSTDENDIHAPSANPTTKALRGPRGRRRRTRAPGSSRISPSLERGTPEGVMPSGTMTVKGARHRLSPLVAASPRVSYRSRDIRRASRWPRGARFPPSLPEPHV